MNAYTSNGASDKETIYHKTNATELQNEKKNEKKTAEHGNEWEKKTSKNNGQFDRKQVKEKEKKNI